MALSNYTGWERDMATITKQNHLETLQNTGASTVQIDEVITFCPGYKGFQTLWVHNNRLVLTRKFIQKNNRIHHDCGTDKPCRLYRATGADVSE
jgi:bifunctional pyridoxal-dependent enzyme with beta-cystathionase and maltose regulon repressor activities